jgi:hypothetical protein
MEVERIILKHTLKRMGRGGMHWIHMVQEPKTITCENLSQ